MSIINYRWSSSRQQNSRLMGSTVNKTSYGFPSLGVVPVAPTFQTITETIHYLQEPLNAVVAGKQPGQEKAKPLAGVNGLLGRLFNE